MSAASWSDSRRFGMRVVGETAEGFFSQAKSQPGVVFDPTWFSSGPNCRSAPRSVTGSPGPTWWHPLQPTSLTSRSPRAGSPATGGGG